MVLEDFLYWNSYVNVYKMFDVILFLLYLNKLLKEMFLMNNENKIFVLLVYLLGFSEL